MNVLLHCSTSKPVLNVALSLRCGNRMAGLGYLSHPARCSVLYRGSTLHPSCLLIAWCHACIQNGRCGSFAGFEPPITPHTGAEVYSSTLDEGDPHRVLVSAFETHRPPVLLSGGCLDRVKGKSHSVACCSLCSACLRGSGVNGKSCSRTRCPRGVFALHAPGALLFY